VKAELIGDCGGGRRYFDVPSSFARSNNLLQASLLVAPTGARFRGH